MHAFIKQSPVLTGEGIVSLAYFGLWLYHTPFATDSIRLERSADKPWQLYLLCMADMYIMSRVSRIDLLMHWHQCSTQGRQWIGGWADNGVDGKRRSHRQ